VLRGQGKWLRFASVRPGRVKEQWAILPIFLHEGGIRKAGDHALPALDAGVGNGTNFFAVEVMPPGREGAREEERESREGGRFELK